jgi:hypothetical protein
MRKGAKGRQRLIVSWAQGLPIIAPLARRVAHFANCIGRFRLLDRWGMCDILPRMTNLRNLFAPALAALAVGALLSTRPMPNWRWGRWRLPLSRREGREALYL